MFVFPDNSLREGIGKCDLYLTLVHPQLLQDCRSRQLANIPIAFSAYQEFIEIHLLTSKVAGRYGNGRNVRNCKYVLEVGASLLAKEALALCFLIILIFYSISIVPKYSALAVGGTTAICSFPPLGKRLHRPVHKSYSLWNSRCESLFRRCSETRKQSCNSFMALTELSAGHIGRNGRAIDTPPGSDTSDTGKRAAQCRTPNDVVQVTLLPTPASIQSMLRNGTELGDIGGLAFNPNRLPSPSQQLSPSTLPSSVPSSASKRNYRYRGEVYLDPNEHNISHSIPPYPAPRGMDDGSSPSFIYRNRSQSSSGQQSRRPSKGHNDGNGRSYPVMHSSSASRSVPRYPSHINGHLRSQGDPRGMRPRSPLVYPTRLKRPGHRPSSPSLTEAYSSWPR